MKSNEHNLDCLLRLVADHIDLDHLCTVNKRYQSAFRFETVDHPPLVIQSPFGKVMKLPPPWNRFQHYSYQQTFQNPVAMLQNMLLDYVVPGLLLKDDNPLAIRNNHGTIQVASLLGGQWKLHEDNYPWIEPLNSREQLEKIADQAVHLDTERGVISQSLATLRFYRDKLAQFPPCGQTIQISMPDLQGPMDTAEQIWGSEIYYAFADTPHLLDRLLDKIVQVTIALAGLYRPLIKDWLDPLANTQHGYQIPGRLMIRNDSSVMLSADTYAKFIRPHDMRLLAAMSGGSIHSCGDWHHLVPVVLDIPYLRGLDFGNPDLMDLSEVYQQCRERKVVMTNVRPSRQDCLTGRIIDQYPTGAVLIYLAQDLEEAHTVLL